MARRRQLLVQALEKTATGSRSALETVFEMTSAKLLGIILPIVRDREVAEDVLQDVYLRVWRRAGRYDPDKGSAIAWLATIARNAAIDEVRRLGKRPEEGDDSLELIADDGQSADEMLCEQEDHDAVRRCLDALEGDQRKSIRLAFFGGLTHSELAERVGVPLGTMKSWIRRGLASLKGCLGYE